MKRREKHKLMNRIREELKQRGGHAVLPESKLGVSIEVRPVVLHEGSETREERWWRAEVRVNGVAEATGWGKVSNHNEPHERDELARGEAIVKARHNFRPPINVREE